MPEMKAKVPLSLPLHRLSQLRTLSRPRPLDPPRPALNPSALSGTDSMGRTTSRSRTLSGLRSWAKTSSQGPPIAAWWEGGGVTCSAR